MKARFPLLLLAALVALAAGGLSWLLGGDSAEAAVGERMPMGQLVEPVADGTPPVAVEDVARPAEAQVVDAGDGLRHEQPPAGWTSGIIRGDVQIAASVYDRIAALQVIVEELRRPLGEQGELTRPWQRVQRVELGAGTPTFEVREVPFSKYGYSVRVHAPGLNGSRQTVQIDEGHPLEESVKLAITPGVPFSLLLRDQDQSPLTAVDVTLAPVGEPTGRPVLKGTTDNFGSVLFADVLAGDYRIFVGHVEQPLVEPQDVTVHTVGQTFRSGAVQGQGCTVLVPRGMPLTVEVRDVAGYGVADAAVRLQATDRVKLTVLEGRTDVAGRFTHPRLQPGIWQIDVHREGFQRGVRQVTVTDGVAVPDQVFQLPRL